MDQIKGVRKHKFVQQVDDTAVMTRLQKIINVNPSVADRKIQSIEPGIIHIEISNKKGQLFAVDVPVEDVTDSTDAEISSWVTEHLR